MFFHRTHVNMQDNQGRRGGWPIGWAMGHAMSALVTAALVCILLGVGVLLFPLILAVFVAGIFFFAALACLGWAWRIFRAQRRRDTSIHVTVSDVEDEKTFLP